MDHPSYGPVKTPLDIAIDYYINMHQCQYPYLCFQVVKDPVIYRFTIDVYETLSRYIND